jgi:alpha-tubulin suppressor-like RCC1 family protein
VSGITNATAISAGFVHTCALISGGRVKCWGDPSYGELGNGPTDTSGSVPVSVVGITTAIAISAGGQHTCAILSNHTVRCWGSNFYGQLGDGTNDDSATPVTVAGITTATAISAGYDHTCALLSGGAGVCWGSNTYGQLGDPTSGDSPTPVDVPGITTATAISAGYDQTCAIQDGGTSNYICWGALGSEASGLISTATAISTGGFQNCALLSDHTVQCWGYNVSGELGDGTTSYFSSSAVTVLGVTSATAISAAGDGTDHTCALLTGGTAMCWGSNGYGELGNGTTTDSSSPSAISELSGATYVALPPARLLDTRASNGLAGPFHVRSARTFQVSGRGGIPSSAIAVTGNLTVTGQTAAGYVFLGPDATNAPGSSTLNFPLGDDRANAVTVGLGAGGTLSATYIAKAGHTTNLIFDVTGYFLP